VSGFSVGGVASNGGSVSRLARGGVDVALVDKLASLAEHVENEGSRQSGAD